MVLSSSYFGIISLRTNSLFFWPSVHGIRLSSAFSLGSGVLRFYVNPTQTTENSVYFHGAQIEHFFLQPGSHALLVLPKFLVSFCATSLSYLLDVRLLNDFTYHFKICAPMSTMVQSSSLNQKQVQAKSLHLRKCKLSLLSAAQTRQSRKWLIWPILSICFRTEWITL